MQGHLWAALGLFFSTSVKLQSVCAKSHAEAWETDGFIEVAAEK